MGKTKRHSIRRKAETPANSSVVTQTNQTTVYDDSKRHRGPSQIYSIKSTRVHEVVDAPHAFAFIRFQSGPHRATGVNGCTPKDVLNILKHHLDKRKDPNFKAIRAITEAINSL